MGTGDITARAVAPASWATWLVCRLTPTCALGRQRGTGSQPASLGGPVPIVLGNSLSNVWRLEQLFSVLTT